MDDTTMKYLLYGSAAVVLAGAVYYLSSDGKESMKLDPSKHTKAQLIEILEDLTLEYSCSFLFMNNIMVNLKEEEPNAVTEEMKNGARFKLKEMTAKKDEDVCKRHKVTVEILQQLIAKFQSDPEVKKYLDRIQVVEAKVFDENQEQIDFELPENLTKESYIQIIRKVLATVRYRYFKLLSEWKEQNMGLPCDENQSAEFLQKVDPEEFRNEILDLFEIKVPTGDTAKRVMQRCYIKYCTGADGKRWNKEIDYEQKVHGEILEKLRKGIRVEKIEIDPLTTKEQSYVVDYSGMPGYQHMDSINDSKFKVQPSEKAQTYVQKMMEKGRQAKDEVQAKKMLEEAEEKKAQKEADNMANSDPIKEEKEGEEQEEKAQEAQPEQPAEEKKAEEPKEDEKKEEAAKEESAVEEKKEEEAVEKPEAEQAEAEKAEEKKDDKAE